MVIASHSSLLIFDTPDTFGIFHGLKIIIIIMWRVECLLLRVTCIVQQWYRKTATTRVTLAIHSNIPATVSVPSTMSTTRPATRMTSQCSRVQLGTSSGTRVTWCDSRTLWLVGDVTTKKLIGGGTMRTLATSTGRTGVGLEQTGNLLNLYHTTADLRASFLATGKAHLSHRY